MGNILAARLARALLQQAARDRYPTRSVEYMLAWVMILWSLRVVWPGDILVGPTYRYLTVLAPESFWGWAGITVGMLRIYALVRNGGWKRSPMLRFVGALLGLNWWLVLTVLYAAAIEGGAADFPMRAAFPAFMFFEAYSCFRCGQDHAAMKRPKCSPASPAGGAGNG